MSYAQLFTLLILYRPPMGFVEFGHFPVYPLRRNSQKSRGSHLAGEVGQSRFLDSAPSRSKKMIKRPLQP